MRILLVQLNANGDCLFATPIARQIKHDFPGCHLTWAISSFCSSVIHNNPFVDDVLVVDTVIKNDVSSIRAFNKFVYQEKKSGIYDEVFIVQHADKNNVYFDGSTRGAILNAYPSPITVSIQPILRNTEQEKYRVSQFVEENFLHHYKHVILFEYAPQSQQLNMSKEFALSIAEALVLGGNTAVILSSPNKVVHENKSIIDGSILSFREMASLSHYCTFFLGCSSGITWIISSDGGKLLPMVQLLDPSIRWFNPISVDFKRFGIDFDQVIELVKYDQSTIVDCVNAALLDFESAKQQFNQSYEVGFRTSRTIVYNFLLTADFPSIAKHVKINFKYHGFKVAFIKEVLIAFLLFPFYQH